MSFRIDVQVLLLATFVFGLVPAAKAQSNGGGQHIVFTAPDGRTLSNAPLPMARAPEPQAAPNLPGGEAAVSPFSGPPPEPLVPLAPAALQQDNTRNRDNSQDPMDFRKQMGLLTPAQIMKVPSAEQIFGLAEKPADSQKKPAQSQSFATNDIDSDTTAIIAEPGWAKAWLGDTEKRDQSTGSSNKTEKASGFFGGYFDTARSDNVFGNHRDGNADTIFGAPQTTFAQQSPWGSQLTSGETAPTPSTAESVANNFTAAGAPGSQLMSQSPFTPPQAISIDALPKLPPLPSARPQSESLSQPASAPSWAPKPPPWTQTQTPLGTSVPLNNTVNR